MSISSIATGSPCTVTTTTDHGLTTGDTIRVAGVTGGTFSPVLTTNPTFQATVTGVRTFTIPVNYSNTTGTGNPWGIAKWRELTLSSERQAYAANFNF